MHKIGVYMLVAGAVATLVGLVAGFGFMFAGDDDAAKLFLGFAPVGVVVIFTGVVTTLIYPFNER